MAVHFYHNDLSAQPMGKQPPFYFLKSQVLAHLFIVHRLAYEHSSPIVLLSIARKRVKCSLMWVVKILAANWRVYNTDQVSGQNIAAKIKSYFVIFQPLFILRK